MQDPEEGQDARAPEEDAPAFRPAKFDGDGAKPCRILLVDDHAVVRHGLRFLLSSQAGIEVCGDVSTAEDAIDFVKREPPDLVVLDLTLPEMSGLDATRHIKEISPATEVLVLTMHFTEELAREVLRAGAIGYVLKSDADTELLTAVQHAQQHQPFFTSSLATAMAERFVGNSAEVLPGTPLTGREVKIVQLLASGKSNKEVAKQLGVSTRTVESHRNHIMRKMNFANFSELIRFAVRANLIGP